MQNVREAIIRSNFVFVQDSDLKIAKNFINDGVRKIQWIRKNVTVFLLINKTLKYLKLLNF